MRLSTLASVLLACGVLSTGVQAAEWSDTALSWRYGNKFAEPYNSKDISKNILGLTHVSGYKYGTNFFNVDMLMSDKNDPASLTQATGAREVYVVYRNTIDFSKISDQSFSYGAIRSVGATVGFDYNTKNDVGYNSRKQMLVVGPTLMWDVPGYLNTSLLLLSESNAPSGAFPPISNVTGRYHYKTHGAIDMNWGIPVADDLAFEGYAQFIAPKGVDEVGNKTVAETIIDMQLMYDIGNTMGLGKKTFKVGFEYQYWKNKFGNDPAIAGPGTLAKTPMIRAEYHF